ncbi:hypothetical protein XA68_13944 [Ophiocordyceps unilateralis]|uniref:Uncharacterized protein n=1 Tax=Ophiocordyceps unilateralis TaxID=268505 RepID=A0A2A9PNA0_OPHUN|nr:hypothetical protein XA68_13944 [Ophiocordyceps unilateralis]
MASQAEILNALRGPLGCNGVRSIEGMGPMRQETLERRLAAAQGQISRDTMAAIYATWLQEQVHRAQGPPPPAVLDAWCRFLIAHGCDKKILTIVWMQAALNALGKWCQVMTNEKVRDVRMSIVNEIAIRCPDADAMDVDRQQVPSQGKYISLKPERPWLTMLAIDPCGSTGSAKAGLKSPDQAESQCRVCGSKKHFSDECPGKAFGYGPSSSSESSAPPGVQGSQETSVPRRQGRRAGFVRPDGSLGQQGSPQTGLQAMSPGAAIPETGSHGKLVNANDSGGPNADPLLTGTANQQPVAQGSLSS